MNWKDLRLRTKFAVGFGLVLALLVAVGVWSILGISGIVDNAAEVIDGNKLKGEMVQREVDHLNWAGKVNALLTDDKVTELAVETDPRQCAFGRWYYGEGRHAAEALVPQIKPLLDDIEAYHNQLHQSAAAIGKVFHQADLSLPQFLAEKEADHLVWANSVLAYFASDQKTLQVETNERLCSLGQFLYGEAGQAAAASDTVLARLLEDIKPPHARLHQSAKQLMALPKQQAQQVFVSETVPALEQTRAVLAQLKERANTLVAGMDQARGIYATQTVPNLEKVQELLGKISRTTDEHIMTDAQMLAAAAQTRTGVLIFVCVAVPLGLLLAVVIARGIIGPLQKGIGFARQVAEGDLTATLDVQQQDEVGQLAAALRNMVEQLQRVVADVRSASDNVAAGSQQLSASSEEMSQGAT
ncbi:methyl-accepting chemotaxis protein, partial [Desulfuromonas thiophila]